MINQVTSIRVIKRNGTRRIEANEVISMLMGKAQQELEEHWIINVQMKDHPLRHWLEECLLKGRRRQVIAGRVCRKMQGQTATMRCLVLEVERIPDASHQISMRGRKSKLQEDFPVGARSEVPTPISTEGGRSSIFLQQDIREEQAISRRMNTKKTTCEWSICQGTQSQKA